MTTSPVPRGHFKDDMKTVGVFLMYLGLAFVLFVGTHTAANLVGEWLIGR